MAPEHDTDSVETNDEWREKLWSDRLHLETLRKERAILALRRERLLGRLLLIMSMTISMFALVLMLNKGAVIEKKAVLDDIDGIISNGGDLSAIKHALASHKRTDRLKTAFLKNTDWYLSDVPLSIVLKDARLDAYRSGETSIRTRIEELINEHEQINPFDKLDFSQKYYFENIRLKAGELYPLIENDVNNLAEDMIHQNRTIEQYLRDSTKSFWISIIALAFSFSLGIYQFFASRSDAQKKIILEALTDFAEKTNDERIDAMAPASQGP